MSQFKNATLKKKAKEIKRASENADFLNVSKKAKNKMKDRSITWLELRSLVSELRELKNGNLSKKEKKGIDTLIKKIAEKIAEKNKQTR